MGIRLLLLREHDNPEHIYSHLCFASSLRVGWLTLSVYDKSASVVSAISVAKTVEGWFEWNDAWAWVSESGLSKN